jgi:hypothetical protein
MSLALLSKKSEAAPASKPQEARSGLRIGAPNDAFEREADRVAEEIATGGRLQWSLSTMRPGAPLQRKCDCGGTGDCEECKDKKKAALQRRAADPARVPVVPRIVHEVLRSPGRPLDHGPRVFFESRFGHDFSKVRIHTDRKAAESAEAVKAFAYAAGSHVVFAHGQYSPADGRGRHLLAHELAHVVQQRSDAGQASYALLPRDSDAEHEAHEAGRSAAGAGTPRIKSRIPDWQIGRAEKTGGGAPSSGSSNPPGGGSSPAPSTGSATPAKRQPLRFDVIGADIPLVNFLAKEAGRSRDPDLRVTSLEDMIQKLQDQTPSASGRCVEHISIYNHGRPGHQVIAGGEEKKGGKPSALPRSELNLDWLYTPANQAALAKLRGVFCCGASMDWLGCGVAGVEAQGGKRTAEEIAKAGAKTWGQSAGRHFGQSHGGHLG